MDKVYEFLLSQIKTDDTFVIALSGGPDSMALLNIMLDIKKKIDINIICAHVNHNSGRPGQKTDQEFVENYCNQNNLKLEVLTIENYDNDNFHNQAHKKRYDFFKDIINKYNAEYLLTAHHGDDLVETILMRIVRGSTLKGYSGFEQVVDKKDYKILRPLIYLTKEQIYEYNKENKIDYVIDTSNNKDVYTRNRFRKNIIPTLKEEEKNLIDKFYKFSLTLQEYNKYIEEEVNKKIGDVYNNNVIDISKFKKLNNLIKKEIIKNILKEIYNDDLNIINDKHVDMINELVNSIKSNLYIELPNNLKVVKEYNNLTFITKKKEYDEYKFEINKNLNLPNNHHLDILKTSSQTDNYICRLNKEDVKFPLYVRTRKDGDKMYVKKMLGSKKINDIFIDSKIPMSERYKWPIVVDSNDTIVWLPGLKKSKYDKQNDEKYDIILRYY